MQRLFLRLCQIRPAGIPGIGGGFFLVDGDEMPLLHHDPAVHHRVVHRAAEPTVASTSAGLYAPPTSSSRRESTRKRSAHLPTASCPMSSRPSSRRCPGWPSSAPDTRRGLLAGGQPVEQVAHPQLLHQGRPVVAGGAVHRQSHRDAQRQHLRTRATPEASFMLLMGQWATPVPVAASASARHR